VSGTWPAELRTTILQTLDRLRAEVGGPVAVRSSATDEDGADASFAGQHETFLNVSDADAALDAVRRCWASLLSGEALRYRQARAAVPATPAMGVVVQAMVDAEASGVAFTIDPVSGDRDVAVVDVARGLGEALVAGTVVPDHYKLRKGDLDLVARQTAGADAILPDDRICEIARLALAIERDLGEAQDVEWAIGDGRLWALQARPVTGVVSDVDRDELATRTAPDTEWTSTNVQEVLPGQLSPLNQSLVLADFDAYSRAALRRMGIHVTSSDPLVGAFYGRAFLNLTLSQEIGGQTGTADKHYLGEEENARRKRPSAKLAKLRLAAAMPKTLWCFARLGRTVADLDHRAALVAPARPSTSAAATGASESPSGARLAAIAELTREVHEVGAVHVLCSIYAGGMFTGLAKLCERWLGDATGELAGRLCRGLSDMDSARPGHELWALSRLVLASPALPGALAADGAAAIAAALDALASDEPVQKFRDQLAAFVDAYGHHSIQEMEISARSWAEDLPTVLSMIKNYLGAPETAAPARSEARAVAAREAATAEALGRLLFLKRPLVRYFLARAQTWIPRREHTKSLLIRAMHRRRLAFRRLGDELVARGALADPWDLYFLAWDEIGHLHDGRLDPRAAKTIIARRRATGARYQTLTLPETFRGRPTPILPEVVAADGDTTLTGIAVSAGVVTGRARVILDPRRDGTLLAGEILVAPITDVGWTPLFPIAAGLVVDIGGALSHGSTVAREYGLPAVVNVKVGTRAIRTGDEVTVDGSRGVVVVRRRT
jgi:pyruvate,water dikinase